MVVIERFAYLDMATVGRLRVTNYSNVVYTMERPWLNNQPFLSCIPEGTYPLSKYSSEKFPDTFQIGNVPGRTHILIHAANYPIELHGCVAPGTSYQLEPAAVWSSRAAMRSIRAQLGAEDWVKVTSIRAEIAQ